jgi:hypothetical protein
LRLNVVSVIDNQRRSKIVFVGDHNITIKVIMLFQSMKCTRNVVGSHRHIIFHERFLQRSEGPEQNTQNNIIPSVFWHLVQSSSKSLNIVFVKIVDLISASLDIKPIMNSFNDIFYLISAKIKLITRWFNEQISPTTRKEQLINCIVHTLWLQRD